MKIATKQPPTGLSRFLFRLPLTLYRHGLGWVFGHRIVVVHHIGRVSGTRRQAVLETIGHDARDGSYLAVSGWGPHAAWYRNVTHTPDITLQVGRHMIPVTAMRVPEAEAEEIITSYLLAHRRLAKLLLPRLMGYTVDGSEADFRALAKHMPCVRFVPR